MGLPEGTSRMLGKRELEPSGMIHAGEDAALRRDCGRSHRWWRIWGRESLWELWFELLLKGRSAV